MRTAFNIVKAIPAAWDLLWADNLRKRAAGSDFRGNTTYLTASDVVEQVRAFAQEQADGKVWGWNGRQWGRSMTLVRISTGHPGGLLRLVRDWLFTQVRAGKLEEFDFGRGHISGARFRPAGSGATEAERKTVAERERRRTVPRPVHISASGTYGGRPLCIKPRGGFYRRPSKYVHTTTERDCVTCPRCLKRAAASQEGHE